MLPSLAFRLERDEDRKRFARLYQQNQRQLHRLAELDSGAAGAAEPETAGKPRNPARWLSVVIIAALLTGAAAGFALGSGERFRELFEKNEWAAGYYKGAANTKQILDMGAGVNVPRAEAGGPRRFCAWSRARSAGQAGSTGFWKA